MTRKIGFAVVTLLLGAAPALAAEGDGKGHGAWIAL